MFFVTEAFKFYALRKVYMLLMIFTGIIYVGILPLMISYAETIRGNGIIEYFMYKQYSDDFYDSFRNTFTVLNLVYRVDTETLRVIFKENINDIIANNKNN